MALVVNGTTGEAPTLRTAEQERLVRLAVGAARGEVPVIAGAGSNATTHTIELGIQAQKTGADGLLIVTSYYNRPSQEGLRRHFAAIHDATDVPLFLYDVPSRTGCALTIDTICRLAELPRIVGLKDASGHPTRAEALRQRLGPDFRLLSGDDTTALDFIARGGDGFISVASNVMPRLCGLMFEVADNQRWQEAYLLQRRIDPLRAALFLESNPIPLKWALSLMGLMSPELRLPLCEPSEMTRAAVQKALMEVGALGPHFYLDAQSTRRRLAS